MEPAEWQEIVEAANADIKGFVRNQRVRSDIESVLRDSAASPVEEDFIYADSLGHDPRVPRIVEVDGIPVVVRTLHRKGLQLSDVKGADLLYEIAGRKFVLIQYKRPDGRQRVTRDDRQLRELVATCPNPCPPTVDQFWPTCGSWFAVVGEHHRSYLPACVAQSKFGATQSESAAAFDEGFSRIVFDELFAKCWIGARIAPSDFTFLAWSALDTDRVLFSVRQIGGW